MRMKHWLEQIPDAMREQIAAHPIHREELQAGRSLMECLTDEAILERSHARLVSLEREALAGICRTFGFNRFQWHDLNRLPAHRSLAEWKSAVAALSEKGFLCIWQKSWKEPSFGLAAEAFPVWSKLAAPVRFEQQVEWKPDELETASGEQSSLVLDILLLARFLQTVGLTRGKQGRWHKAACRKLEQQLRVAGSEWSMGEPGLSLVGEADGHLSAGAAAVVDIAARLGLLCWIEGRLSLHLPAWQAFLSESGVRLTRHVSKEWLIWHAPVAAWQQHAGFAILAMPESGWYDLKELYLALLENGCLPDGADWASFASSLAHVLDPMVAFGWLRIVTLRDGRILLHKAGLMASPEDDSSMQYISPQGEVMVPLAGKLEMHWELLCCAELETYSEPVPMYRFTRTSVLRGKELGKSALGLLHRSGIEPPDSLREQLQDWESRYGEIEVGTRTVIRCRDAVLAEQIQQLAQLGEGVELAGEGLLVLAADAEQSTLVKLLSGSGFHVAWRRQEQPLHDGNPASAAELLRSAVTGYEDQPLPPPAAKLPSIPELYERMSAIPPSWLHEFRKYHPSTGRQMMEQAIRYRSGVQLRVQGDDIVFHPERVVGDRSGWKVEGWVAARPQEREMKQLSPKEWEEIQLILPGINDNNEVLRS